MKYLAAITLLLLANVVFAATNYVSKTGSDGNPGTEAQPWLTVKHAATNAQSGDVVVVGAGTYDEWVRTQRNGPIHFKGSGATISGFRFYHNQITVSDFVINGTGVAGQDGALQLEYGTRDITITNCTITGNGSGTQVFGVRSVFGAELNTTPANVTFLSNYVYATDYMAVHVRGSNWNIGNCWFDFVNGWDCIRMQGQSHWIHDNVFTNISEKVGNDNHVDILHAFGSGSEDCFNILLERNIAVNCANQGIRCEPQGRTNFYGWVVRNNLFANQGAATVMLGGWNCDAFNNTFYHCTTNTGHPLSFFGGMVTNGISRAYNNLFVGCGLYDGTNAQFGWYSADYFDNVDGDYNYVCGKGPAYAVKNQNPAGDRDFNFVEVHGINGGNPLFVSDGSNFRLASTSPCLNTGTNLSVIFNDDLIKTTRGSQWDIGAYEYTTETPQTEPSTTVTNIIRALNVQTQKLVIQR